MDLISAFEASPGFFIAAMSALGLMVGSFLNVVIHRLPIMMEREWESECRTLLELGTVSEKAPFNLVQPRSRCPRCKKMITAMENIPIVSFLALRGKCRQCGESISVRYPIIEALAGIGSGMAAWYFGFGAASIAAAALVWALIALAGIDIDTQYLPDSITVPMLWLGMLLGMFEVFVDLRASVLGAVFGYLSLWSIYWLFKLVTGKESMGHGDFKLLAMLGAWLGWQTLPAIILLSSAVGAVTGVFMIVSGLQQRSEPIPFGPYLAGAGIIALVLGPGADPNLYELEFGALMRALVVAVTGGIGSGKSTVCEAFARFGVASIDTDQIAREVVVPGEPGFEAVVRAFGTSVLDAEGALDRRRVKSMVFADPTLREQLEAILHPLIRARVEQLVHEVEAPYCLVCIPLLTEGKENALVDRVLVVDCPQELQMERVVSRDDLTEREVLAIMHTQASREERLKIADDVIYNDGNREELTGLVSALHETYSQLALAR